MPDRPQTQRMFLAIWLPYEVVRSLDDALTPLRETAPDWLRWQPQERWHVTVLFLGSCTQAQADRAAAKAAQAAGRANPGPLQLQGAGRTSSVLWLNVAGAEWLRPLNRQLSQRLLPSDRRERFHPHVTVARARGHRVERHHVDLLRDHRGPEWTPPELALVRSFTGPHPSYETVAVFPFNR